MSVSKYLYSRQVLSHNTRNIYHHYTTISSVYVDQLRLIFYELTNPSVCIYNFVQIIYFIEWINYWIYYIDIYVLYRINKYLIRSQWIPNVRRLGSITTSDLRTCVIYHYIGEICIDFLLGLLKYVLRFFFR